MIQEEEEVVGGVRSEVDQLFHALAVNANDGDDQVATTTTTAHYHRQASAAASFVSDG